MISEIFPVESFVWTCLWQSMVLIVMGLTVSFLLKRRSSRAHQILLLSILAAVIVPVISALVKHYELGVFVAEPVVMQSQLEYQVIESDFSQLGPVAGDFGHEPGPIEGDLAPVMAGSQSAPLPWPRIALYGWIAASLILTIRLLVTFVLGVRLLGQAQSLDCAKMEEAAHSARAKLGIGREVEVYSSRGVRSPVIWCWRRRPVLLVPSAAGRSDRVIDWTGVLCHELAHWKRRDHISGLLAELAVCVLPWHPLLWWAKSRLISLSEQACDDWVLATGQPGADYAESLLDLAPAEQMAFVPTVVSSKKGLQDRVRRILKESCGNPRTGARWAVTVSIAAVCIVAGIALAQTRPAKPDVESAAVEPDELVDPNEPMVSVNFKNVELRTIVRKLAEWTDKVIIPGAEAMEQKLAIYAPQKLPKDDAVALILNGLRAKDYIVEETANAIIILRTSKEDPGEASTRSDESAAEEVDKEKLVQQLYKVEEVKKEYESVKLGYADVSEVVERLNEVIQQMPGTELQQGILIQPLPRARQIIIFGPKDRREIVKKLIAEIDIPSGLFETRVFQLKYADADKVKENLEDLYEQETGYSSGSGGYSRSSRNVETSETARIIAFPTKHQVTVIASPENMRKIAEQIAEWDVPLDLEQIKPRIFTLRNSDPIRMAKLLNTLFAGDDGDRVNIYDVTFGKDAEEKRKTVGPLSRQLTFQNVPGTNKIIVTSNFPEAYDIVGKLILELDKQKMADKDVKQVVTKIFTIRYRDPEELVRLLRRAPSPKPAPGQSRMPVVLVAESRYKSIIATGSAEDIEWIGERIAQLDRQPARTALPAGWNLDYDDGRLPGGARHWPANMAKDLASLQIRLKPYDPSKASLKGEEYEFRIFSPTGHPMGNINLRPETKFGLPSSKVLKPGKYVLKYRRRWGPSGDNFRMECGDYPIDLSKPGMYELTFTPKIGTAEITGTLGGCYAMNFEKIGSAPWVRGFAYVDPRLGKKYLLDGLPPGRYLLNAVTQRQSDNVFVDRAEATVATDEKTTVDTERPAKSNCTLKGTILGKQRKYATPWPDTWPQSQGKWYVLIRKLGSGAVGRVDAYEALTMDSLYVVRGRNLTQESEDRANYRIEGVAPGDYTVTAIEHPSWGGCVVTRQQSKRLTLRPAENVLDFDFRNVLQPNHNPGAEAGNEKAAGLIEVTGLAKDPQGRSVAGTGVTLFQTKLEYVTDAEGKFTASLPPSDKMRYFFAVHKQRKLVASGRLAGGKRSVEMNLIPARIVSGLVFGPNGRPLSGAQVAPLPMTCFHVLTDKEGRFDVGWSPEWHAPDQELCLMARHTELNLARVVDIAPEAQTMDFMLEPALALHGTIEDSDGRPVLGAAVGLSLIRGWGAGTPVKDVITDYQGRFELPALPQRHEYGISANAEGFMRNVIKTGIINNVTDREEIGAITLSAAPRQREGKAGLGRLFINVVDEDGKAVDIDSVLIWNKRDDGGSRGERFPAVATNKQGFYEIRNVPVGKHHAISVDKEGFARLKKFDIEVKADSNEVIGCALSRGGIIEGFVTDEQNNPVVGVPVVVNSTSGQGTKNLTTDENGHFIATHVADGRHSVYAHPPAGSPYEIQSVKGGVLCGTKDVHIVFKRREESKEAGKVILKLVGPNSRPVVGA